MVEGENRINTNQLQVQDILFKREIGWKEILLDLINSKELDPWDIDISILTESFFEKIKEFEEMDFFVSSQVLLAASLLLRLKSELLLNVYLKNIDDVLFGENENTGPRVLERLELDEDIPDLVLKSPVPRYKKVTLNELIESLNKAIVTENRRIKKTIVNQNALREAGIIIPKKKVNREKNILLLHSKLKSYFDANVSHKSVTYTRFIGKDSEERAISFAPLLQLENNGKIWLDQKDSFGEIDIWLKDVYLKHNPDPFSDLKEELGELDGEELERFHEVEEAGDLVE